MKKLCLWLSFGLLAVWLYGGSASIIALPVPAADLGNDPQKVAKWVRELSQKGLTIYYYNDFFLLAQCEKPDYPRASYLCKSDARGLYLLADKSANRDIPPGTELLWDLVTSRLIRTELTEAELRLRYHGKILPFGNTPMTLKSPSIQVPTYIPSRNFITDMLNLVSQDSLIGYVQHLQNYQSRYACHDNRIEIANWLSGKFQDFGYSNATLSLVPWQNSYQYNVTAMLPGSVYPESYILVGAHYDSQNWDCDPLQLSPGADDNATGVATILEIARIMKATNYQPRCSIVFVPLAGEEIGCIGTYGYIQHAQQSGMDIRLMINMDMIGNTLPHPQDNRMLLHSYDGCLEHAYYAAGLIAQYTDLSAVMGPLNEFITDSYPFWAAGYPAISFDEFWMSPVYHSSLDTVDYLDPGYFRKLAKSVLAMAAHYSYLSSPPTNLSVADTGSGSSLQLNWDAVTDPLVDHYKVRWGVSEWDFSFAADSYTNSFQITGLSEGDTCFIAVSSVDQSGLESYQTRASGIPMPIPRTPNGLSEMPQLDAIALSWNPNQELDLASYHLYRSLSEQNPGELIAVINAPQTTYCDSGLPGLIDYYCYRLSAVDFQGNESSLSSVVKSRPVTLDNGILIIDETMNYNGSNPFQPTDEMVDGFYSRVMQNLPVNASIDLEEHNELLRLADLGIYSSILWHGNDFSEFTRPSQIKAVLQNYLELGGKILFSVCHPSQAFELNGAYPAVFGADTFINTVLGVQGVSYTNSARFRYAISQMDVLNNLQVDSLKTPAGFEGHIFHVEGLVPVNSAEPFFCYGSDYQSETAQGIMNGDFVALRHNYGNGLAVLLSYPLYFMQESEVRELLHMIFVSWFNEPVQVVEDIVPVPTSLIVCNPFPNPFRKSTTIRLEGVDIQNYLMAEIFNLKGQLVWKTVINPANSVVELNWNGLDSNDRQLSSGIYIVKVFQKDKSRVSKLLHLK